MIRNLIVRTKKNFISSKDFVMLPISLTCIGFLFLVIPNAPLLNQFGGIFLAWGISGIIFTGAGLL